MKQENPSAATRFVGIDGRAFPVRTILGVVGRVAHADARTVELRQPMGHVVRVAFDDLAKVMGGPQNALALFNDARSHNDAVAIRFETTGCAYYNTEQFLRFERARGNGDIPPFSVTDSQTRAAAREARAARTRMLVREERAR
jgi:hypothetical protein